MALMTVYHGGFQSEPKPEFPAGADAGDFGSGFYCALIKEQAERNAGPEDIPPEQYLFMTCVFCPAY